MRFRGLLRRRVPPGPDRPHRLVRNHQGADLVPGEAVESSLDLTVQHRHRPSIDALFLSAADAFGPRVTGVLLSGMGSDGVRGCIAIKARKGLTLVQAPEQARFPAMPMSALREDDIDAALPVERLAGVLVQLAHGTAVQPNGDAPRARPPTADEESAAASS